MEVFMHFQDGACPSPIGTKRSMRRQQETVVSGNGEEPLQKMGICSQLLDKGWKGCKQA